MTGRCCAKGKRTLFNDGIGIGGQCPGSIERLAIIRLQRFEIGEPRKVVEREFRWPQLKRSRQQPVQDLASAEIAEISCIGMRDQPRAVAFCCLRDPPCIKLPRGEQRNILAPARAAERIEVGFDCACAIKPVSREMTEVRGGAVALESLFHREVGGKQIAQEQNITVAAGFAAKEIADDAGSFGFDMERFGP
jgi:hypothetical protein